jgi:prevent-host-death family protein
MGAGSNGLNAVSPDAVDVSPWLARLLAMQVNMHEAKTTLSELVAAAESGEEVIIARNGTPAARLVAVTAEHAPVRLGVLAGEIELGPDFDEPLPEFEPYSA